MPFFLHIGIPIKLLYGYFYYASTLYIIAVMLIPYFAINNVPLIGILRLMTKIKYIN